MNKLLVVAAVAASLAGAGLCWPKDKPDRSFHHVYNGVGTWSCGSYLKYRKDSEEETDKLVAQWAAGYFAGFTSAWGMAKSQSLELANDLETYGYWTEKWCRDDPSSRVSSAIHALLLKQRDGK